MVSNEYTVLVDDQGKQVQRIIPNEAFDTIAGDCINTAYCVIKDKKDGTVVHILSPGARTPKKEVAKSVNYDEMSNSQLRELLRAKEVTFPTKATKAKLIEMLS